MAIIVGPNLKIVGEFVICDHVNGLEVRNGREIVQDPLDHRLPGNFKKRFRLVESERIKSCGVTGGQNERVHERDLLGLTQHERLQPLLQRFDSL